MPELELVTELVTFEMELSTPLPSGVDSLVSSKLNRMGLVTTPDNIMCVYIISITLGYFSSIFIVIMSGPRSDIILTPLGGVVLRYLLSIVLRYTFVRSFHSTQQNLLYIWD